jgi:hypothetical protein
MRATSIVVLFAVLPSLGLWAQIPPGAPRVSLSKTKAKSGGTDCEDKKFQVLFHLPPKWTFEGGWRLDDAGQPASTLRLRDSESKGPVGLYYRLFVNPQPMTSQAIAQALTDEVDRKVDLRGRQGLNAYTIDPQRCEHRQAGGHEAFSCVAQYRSTQGDMQEYLTWVRSERCIAQFWVMAPPNKMADVRTRMESLIQSLRIP